MVQQSNSIFLETLDSIFKNRISREDFSDKKELSGGDYLNALVFIKEIYISYLRQRGSLEELSNHSALTWICKLPDNEWLNDNKRSIYSVYSPEKFNDFERFHSDKLQESINYLVGIRNLPEFIHVKKKATDLIEKQEFLGTVHDGDFISLNVFKKDEEMYCVGGVYNMPYNLIGYFE